MLSAIREIGRWQINKSSNDKAAIYTGQNFRANDKVIFIKLNTKKKAFEEIGLEDFDSGKINRYLFKKGGSKGNKPSPIPQITGKAERTFKKIKTWFKNCLKSETDSQSKALIETVNKVLTKNERRIVSEIKEKTEEIKKLPKDKQGSIFLIVKIDGKYVGNFNIFSKLYNEFKEKKDSKVSANNKKCSACGEEKNVRGDNADVLKFSTIDKPGFITGGFAKANAWKNFPLCSECKSELDTGKSFMESKLKQTFVYGLDYILIPKLLFGKPQILDEVLSIFSDTNKLVSIKKKVKKMITDDKEEILEILSQEKDSLTLSFLFMERKSGSSSAEKILQLIEDIFPSRIRRIFEAKDFVDKVTGNSFTFRNVREFFAKSDDKKRNYDLDKYFLEIIDKVFKGTTIDFSFLIRFFMARVRREFTSDGYFNPIVKSALMSTLFFENLNLITFKEVKDMEKSIFDSIFTRYGKSLAIPEKKGVFLIGALTQLLLNKQWADRNAKPFMKQLKGLKMDERDIKNLLPKVQNKLEEYDSFDKGKRLIASEISKYFLEAGRGWKMPVDEINFYFACGMNLTDEIATIVYPKENTTKKEE